MRIAFLDMVSGISGDMMLGACVGAGVPLDRLVEELRKLPLDGYRIERRDVLRSNISAVKIDVIEHDAGVAHRHAHPHDPEDTHHHAHPHDAGDVHRHARPHDTGNVHQHAHAHAHQHQRGYLEIVELIETSTLSDAVKKTAQALFLTLARAEAAVHRTTIDAVHFHEVGAVDSIVDIVGAAVCLDMLGIERVYTTPVRTGSGGTIHTQHGIMPIPAPATVELLKGYPIELTDIPHELTTPTGATIVATLSAGVLDRSIPMRVEAIGYGAGSKQFDGLPNMLRLVLADIDDATAAVTSAVLARKNGGARDEMLVLLETNIDDMNSEVFPFILERLLAAGARDAWLAPVLMKKGRPAQVLSVLADRQIRDSLVDMLLRETTTTGVRMSEVLRRSLPREIVTVDSVYGPVRVKVISRATGRVHVPEFEECRRIALERNLPLIDVFRTLEIEFHRLESILREPTDTAEQC